MGKDHSLVAREHNIRFTWQASIMEAEAEAFGEEPLAEQNFGFCILAPDAGHHP
jgi:hypothetical protein